MTSQTLEYNSYEYDQQYNGAAILLQTETAPLRCTVVVTTQFSEYTIFLKILRKHDLLDESYNMIEMHHAKRRMTYVQPLNLLVVQIENIERLWYLNITPEKNSPYRYSSLFRCEASTLRYHCDGGCCLGQEAEYFL